jgi:hypothetical protein
MPSKSDPYAFTGHPGIRELLGAIHGLSPSIGRDDDTLASAAGLHPLAQADLRIRRARQRGRDLS